MKIFKYIFFISISFISANSLHAKEMFTLYGGPGVMTYANPHDGSGNSSLFYNDPEDDCFTIGFGAYSADEWQNDSRIRGQGATPRHHFDSSHDLAYSASCWNTRWNSRIRSSTPERPIRAPSFSVQPTVALEHFAVEARRMKERTYSLYVDENRRTSTVVMSACRDQRMRSP